MKTPTGSTFQTIPFATPGTPSTSEGVSPAPGVPHVFVVRENHDMGIGDRRVIGDLFVVSPACKNTVYSRALARDVDLFIDTTDRSVIVLNFTGAIVVDDAVVDALVSTLLAVFATDEGSATEKFTKRMQKLARLEAKKKKAKRA